MASPFPSMDHQEQYYNAKVFLKQYGGALLTLEQCAKQQFMIKRYELATKNLVHAVAQNFIKIEGDQVTKTKNYKGSKPYHMGEFANTIFGKYLPTIKYAKNYGQLAKQMILGIQMMAKQTNEDGQKLL